MGAGNCMKLTVAFHITAPCRPAASPCCVIIQDTKGHDVRGTSRFLSKVQSEPQLLAPQVTGPLP